MRFKPPPSFESKIGWRVEFRSLDIQLTDFENASFIVFIGMLVNVINTFNVDFIVPISKIDQNMERAHKRDGVLEQKFWVKSRTIGKNYTENCLAKNGFVRSQTSEDTIIEERE